MSEAQLPRTRPESVDVLERARRIAVVAFDVDGTLTDGRIHIGPGGEAMKSFYVRDGMGIALLRRMWPVYEAGIEAHFAAFLGRSPQRVTAMLGRMAESARAK